MIDDGVQDALKAYAARIRELRRAHPDVSEPALAPSFQQLLETLLPLLPAAPELTVVPEFENPGIGRPDIALTRPGQPARAFLELKAPSKPANPTRWTTAHDKRQFERLQELSHWAACNFFEVRLYNRDEETGQAIVVPEGALDSDRSDAKADELIDGHDPGPFLQLLERLASADAPAAANAKQLAQLMAHSARLVRGIVADKLAELSEQGIEDASLLQVRQEFRDALYARPEAGGFSGRDFDELFSAAFAQTLAFGLLLVREGTGERVDEDAWERMPGEHPLMQTALRVLSMPEVVNDMGISFDVMIDTVNSFDAAILGLRPDGSDPILYFYEDFLETFDPDAREKYGVYYTPIEVVRYMVAALDRALRENLGTGGLSDQDVTILDPATGTGTFLLGIIERLRTNAEANGGPGMVDLALRDLAARMFGFELLVGPYAVAHYRLHHALRQTGEGDEEEPPPELPPFERLGIYLADTLARPGADDVAGPLGFVTEGIRDERREANRIKSEQPILAILGNPPYRRLEAGERDTLVGNWLDEMWQDLKDPVIAAKKGGELNTFHELSVAFWRWAIWKIFEAENAPGCGVVAFISNRKYLTGWPYAGLRKMLRERFDRVEIIDLRGDVRRGARGNVESDEGVFNIQVGTAITLAIADGSKAEGELAEVRYSDSWAAALFSKAAKLHWLQECSEPGAPPEFVPVVRGALEDMRPEPFQNGEWLSLKEAFEFAKSGMKSGDDNSFVSVYANGLRDSVPPKIEHRADPEYNENLETYYSYRPFDRRWFYNDLEILDRPGPQMQDVWGGENVGLYSLPSGIGFGPAIWCHGLLPDYHAFRGSYGGYAFPLYDRRPEEDPINLSPVLLESLGAAYGEEVTAEAVFDAILAILSASTYSARFAEDLEDVFPHIPFPATREIFDEASGIGAEIRAVETFSRAPGADYLTPQTARFETPPTGDLTHVDLQDGALRLCADGSGHVTGIPQAVWDFSVSGYRVLPRWLEARRGLPVDHALVTELRDITGRIAELIDLFVESDTVLERTLGDTLTREGLGFGIEEDDEE